MQLLYYAFTDFLKFVAYKVQPFAEVQILDHGRAFKFLFVFIFVFMILKSQILIMYKEQ